MRHAVTSSADGVIYAVTVGRPGHRLCGKGVEACEEAALQCQSQLLGCMQHAAAKAFLQQPKSPCSKGRQ